MPPGGSSILAVVALLAHVTNAVQNEDTLDNAASYDAVAYNKMRASFHKNNGKIERAYKRNSQGPAPAASQADSALVTKDENLIQQMDAEFQKDIKKDGGIPHISIGTSTKYEPPVSPHPLATQIVP